MNDDKLSAILKSIPGPDPKLCRACNNWNHWHGQDFCTAKAIDEPNYGMCWCEYRIRTREAEEA